MTGDTAVTCKCMDVVFRLKKERDAVYREIWDRVMNASKRMVFFVTEATCCHSQLTYNMYSWMCVSLLNMVPSSELRELTGKVCSGSNCVENDRRCASRALSLVKSHRAVVARVQVRHQRALEPLHKECCDMMWDEVATLKTPIRDFSQIVYNKLDEKYFHYEAPMQPLTTNPHGVVHVAIADIAVGAGKQNAWIEWRTWFLHRIQHIKAQREANARKLLNEINW